MAEGAGSGRGDGGSAGAGTGGTGRSRPDRPPRTSGDRAGGTSGAADAGKTTDDSEARGTATETPLTQQIGRIALAVVAVLFGIFAVANAQYVEFSWIFGQTEVVERGGERLRGGVPLIVLLVTSFGLGALVGGFAAWRSRRRR